MIDLGLSKLAIIGVVALIVIGPEKLPKVARMAGSLYGRAQRYLNDVKSEVTREIEMEELKNIQKDVQEAASSFKNGIDNHISSHVGEVKDAIAQNVADVESAWRDEVAQPTVSEVASEQLALKAREFRRKKLVRSSAVPAWYKQRHGGKMRVISGAARVAKYSPGTKSHASFY
jgi:sec-independent protein translocase protein TatB